MLAYRHAFHAGNHADVLKHLVLVQVLRHMAAKDKPYRLIDTHAGAGSYILTAPEAQKTGEYEQGIARLWGRRDLPPATSDYLQLVRKCQAPGATTLTHYPGSPQLSRMLLRPHDEHRLYELHPTDHRLLDGNWSGSRGTMVFKADGFASLRSQLPPPSRRAAILMDPSYELITDYAKTVAAVKDALSRFSQAVIMIWYPQVSRHEAAQFCKRLETLAPGSWVHARLSVQQVDAQGFGLAGSGMFVINAPYTLAQTLRKELPFLVSALAQHDGASFTLNERAV
ncbi:23S rRNA (adenine2030-N6)-methyltransferase [Sphaerotilus hippei]|uniref:Ribosomal RNA large subunit methyltransferase J n=1 Tax=Sphaerotilus hippei TaxID=744406 RepID=A0A318H3C0_9BURK|nr:23S rRNA (adenine(2030)-N(6))-methyltransferase RlmJ [Sphaerotilus hippei]PXW97940.1 23S rRNA (adenine2030-N6)-methyltransferase [Sphaerotilus hippei]